MEPEKVPEKLKNPINKKILLLILGLAIVFQTFVYTAPETDEIEYVIAAVSILNPLVASIFAFYISKMYGSSIVFGKSYAVLGTALFMMFLGESTWYIYIFLLGIDPYPSIADVLFFAFYPLAATHIILNVKFFNTKIDLHNKVWIGTIPVTIVIIYLLFSLQEGVETDIVFYTGLLFVIGSSVLLSLGLLGAIVFRGGVLGIAWLLLLIGILLTTTGDVWYYYIEIPGTYYSGHPVELLWYTSYWLITYALFKHKKII